MRRLIIALLAGLVPAAGTAAPADSLTHWNAEANGPGRFVAAHGQRSVIMGYPQTGLEVWAYPLQLLSGYQLRFRESGRVEPFEGRALLSRIETGPTEVVRVYNGPDFVVREHLFAPLSEPGAILSYEVEGKPDVQIEARFEPSLNLMWPGALGGQEVQWDDSRSGYVEREPVHHFSAFIRSPETVAHDSTVNVATNRPAALGLVMQPRSGPDGVRRAELLVSQDQAGGSGPLEGRAAELRTQASGHYASVLSDAVEITTPDPAVNRALESSIVALEQAWVCTPQIGCGNVGGYGPSRPGRRPQYAWYFAGDGLVATESFLAAGRYERARDELEFITRYQNKTNGMIWHEMTTSAPLIDWEKNYPYMYVHVDITLQYLSTLADYIETTGDTHFLAAHWAGIEAAWHYARSLVDPRTGLPSIPAGKEGQNEQAVLRDDVNLSVAWIEAAKAFASIARARGDARLAREGDEASAAALKSVRDNYWDEANGFWFGGHKASGEPLREHQSGAVDVLAQGAFTPTQADRALNRLASPDFQTDWGMRSLPASDPDYDPNAYSAGAVWGLGSSGASTTFWQLHRPFTAWNAWHGLVRWSSLDSLGHMHEVLAGDLFHPELESVPEQTWSSAGFLSAAVEGLLGLRIQAAARTLAFAPHLPADWGGVSVRRMRVGSSNVDLQMTENAGAVGLQIENAGPGLAVDFDPEISLGARLLGAEVNGVATAASVERTAQDQHARVRVSAGPGVTNVVVRYSGGVRIAPVETAPSAGDHSVNLKLVSADWLPGDVLKLKAYVADPAHAAIDLVTPMAVAGVEGADVSTLAHGRYRLVLHTAGENRPDAAYVPVDVMVKLQGQ